MHIFTILFLILLKINPNSNLIADRCITYNIPQNHCMQSVYIPNFNYDNYINYFNLPIVKDPICQYQNCTIQITKNPLRILINKPINVENRINPTVTTNNTPVNINDSQEVHNYIQTVTLNNVVTTTISEKPETITVSQTREEVKTDYRKISVTVSIDPKINSTSSNNIQYVTITEKIPTFQPVTIPQQPIISTVTIPQYPEIKTSLTSVKEEKSTIKPPEPEIKIVTLPPEIKYSTITTEPEIKTVTLTSTTSKNIDCISPCSSDIKTETSSSKTESIHHTEKVTVTNTTQPETRTVTVVSEKTIDTIKTITHSPETSSNIPITSQTEIIPKKSIKTVPEKTIETTSKQPEPEIVTVVRYKTKTKTNYKPLTLYREILTTVEKERPIINYKLTTFTELKTMTKTLEKEYTTTITKTEHKEIYRTVTEKREIQSMISHIQEPETTIAPKPIPTPNTKTKETEIQPECTESCEDLIVTKTVTKKDRSQLIELIKMVKEEINSEKKKKKRKSKKLEIPKTKKFKTKTFYSTIYSKKLQTGEDECVTVINGDNEEFVPNNNNIKRPKPVDKVVNVSEHSNSPAYYRGL